MMSERSVILHLLYFGFTDIRAAAADGNVGGAARIADLLHNIPLKVESALAGAITFQEILADVQQRAGELGCEKWLSAQLVRCANRASAKDD